MKNVSNYCDGEKCKEGPLATVPSHMSVMYMYGLYRPKIKTTIFTAEEFLLVCHITHERYHRVGKFLLKRHIHLIRSHENPLLYLPRNLP